VRRSSLSLCTAHATGSRDIQNGWIIYRLASCVCVCVCVCIYIYTHTHTHTHTYIQDVSRLADITVGGDFLGLCDQKVHKNMCPILDGYGVTAIFLFPYTPSCEPRLTEPAGGWCTQLGGLSLALQALFWPRDSPTQLQTVQFPYLDTWNVCKECGEGGVGGYSPDQCKLLDSATTTCSITHITYITATADSWCSEQYGYSFVKAWAVEATVCSAC